MAPILVKTPVPPRPTTWTGILRSEVLLIPKMIECEREVRVGVKNKNSYAQDEIVYMDESKSEPSKSQPQAVLVVKKRGILEYIKSIIAKFRKIIKK